MLSSTVTFKIGQNFLVWGKEGPDTEKLNSPFRCFNSRTRTLGLWALRTPVDFPLFQLSRAKKRGDVAPGEASSRDVFLIPEFCAMTGLTEEMRSDRGIMQALAQYTRVPPEERIDRARRYLSSLFESV